jgi:tubulin monoglycylase TTLL3/8
MPAYYVAEKATAAPIDKEKSATEKQPTDDSDCHYKIFGRIDLKLWKSHYQRNEKCERRIGELTYVRRTRLLEKKEMRKVEDSRSLKVHNHLEGNYFIGNKKALLYNMRRYLQLKGEDPFLKLPLTFHVSKGTEDAEYLRFLQYYDNQEQKKSAKGQRNIWIVKPGENTNRGNGITVCHSLDDVRCRLRGRERNGDGKLRTFILQKYIENPLLYNRRKIDLRHYLLVSCVNGCFKGYWYE